MTDAALEIPETFDAMDCDWLTRALRSRQLLSSGQAEVSRVRVEQIGEGEGFMCVVARLHLEYTGDAANAPKTMIVKLPSLIASNRMMGELLGSYWREIYLYEELCGKMTINTPSVYYSDLTDDPMRPRINSIMRIVELMPAKLVDLVMSKSKDIVSDSEHRYVLLIEDLAPAVPGDQLTGASPERCAAALTTAAKLHAQFWQHPILDEAFWITDPRVTMRSRHRMFLDARPGFLDRFSTHLGDHEMALFDWFDTNGVKFLKMFHKQTPATLQHGDFRMDNVFFDDAKGEVILADWQMTGRGPAAEEVAYLLSGALDVNVPTAIENELVEHYHSELTKAGVTGYDLERFKKDYKRGMLLMLRVHGSATDDIEVGEDRGDALMNIWLDRTIARLKDVNPDDLW